MPLPISTVLLVAAAFLVFGPEHISELRRIVVIVIWWVVMVNEFLRMFLASSRRAEPDGLYEIPAAPREPVAHRDTPE